MQVWKCRLAAGRALPLSRPLLPFFAARIIQRAARQATTVNTWQSVAISPPPSTAPPPWNRPGTHVTEKAIDQTDDITQAMLSGSMPKPADKDRTNFQLHWSVDFWRDFQVPEAIKSDETSIPSKLRILTQKMRDAGVWSSSQATAYWTYHMGRTGFLAVQGLVGLLAAQGTSQATGDTQSDRGGFKFNNVLKWGISPLYEAMVMFWQDYKNITAGTYKLPWDMTTRGHKQWNPIEVFNGLTTFVREAASTLDRRTRGSPDDVWLKSRLYPDYYLNTFHYQTDGWLSQSSASIYELSTETLFVGRQDAMQRQTLVPLAQHLRSGQARSTAGALPRILEVACGTGRFATFLKDNHPSAEVSCLELSPYYLAEARKNMTDWARLRDKGNTAPPTHFLQAAAESIPAADNHYDAITCIYLFHELPADIRKQVAQEMARVVKPGGMVIITDSVQLGDRPANDKSMGGFGNFNEPYYRSYITTDLGNLFSEAGLQPDTKLVGSSSKTLSFIKPLQSQPVSTTI